MPQFQFVAQIVHDLLQRGHFCSKVKIAGLKGPDSDTCDLRYCSGHHGKLMLRVIGENDPLFTDLVRASGDAHGMVGDTLEVRERVQVYRRSLSL